MKAVKESRTVLSKTYTEEQYIRQRQKYYSGGLLEGLES